MPLSLLFIEDSEDILLNLFAWFERQGHICDCARNGLAGLGQALAMNYDCIVLDIMLPGLSGIEVCRRLRGNGRNLPIIMLTAKDAVDDRILGLESGADDYLVKPFSLKELEARIRAVMRRGRPEKNPLRFGPLELDPQAHKAFRAGIELRLSPSSFAILERLLAQAPDLVRKDELETLLWGDDPPTGSALRNQIHELRKALDKPFHPPLLETVPHLGWRLRLPDA